jgi:lipopolysaccharide transport system permease protein
VPSTASRPLTCIEPPSLGSVRLLGEIGRLATSYDLLRTLSIHRIKVRYKQSRLGLLWAILQPLAMMLAFTLMFHLIGGAPAEGVPYAVFVYAALLPWTAFASGLSSATGALTGHAALLTKVSFPREILPLTYVVVALVDLCIAATVLFGMMAWYRISVTIEALWAVPAIAVLTAWLVAAGLLLSALQVRYRDVGLAMPVVLQVWLFASPVLYPLATVQRVLPARFYALYVLNPMAGIVETIRRTVVLHQAPDLQALVTSALISLALLPIAYTYFKFTERTMADVI